MSCANRVRQGPCGRGLHDPLVRRLSRFAIAARCEQRLNAKFKNPHVINQIAPLWGSLPVSG